MASGPTVGGDGTRERRRYIEGRVYRRKVFKGTKKNPNVGDTVVSTAATTKEDNAPTTSVTNDTDIKHNSTVENRNVDETKSNANNDLAPQSAVSEDGNLAQPEGCSRLESGNTAQPQESSRLEDGNLPQKQLEEQNLEQEQVSLRTGDGNSPQKQLEDRDLEQEQVSLRTGDADSPQHQLENQNLGRQQVSSGTGDENSPHQQLDDQNSAQQHVSSRTEDRNSPQPQTNSRQEDGDSPLPQENSRQMEDENSAQPELNSRLEDGSLPQPELNSRLEDGSLPLPELNSRLEDDSLPQPELDSKLEDRTSQQQDNSILEDGNLPQQQVNLRLEDGSLLQPPVNSTLEDHNLDQLLSPPVSDDLHSHQQAEPSNLNVQREDDGPSSPISIQEVVPSTGYLPSVNVPVEPCLEDRIKINLALTSKQEKQEIRWKLESELDVVRSLVKRIEVKQGQVGGYGHSNVVLGSGIANGGGGKRAHSEVASAGVSRQPTRPLYQLSLSMLHNSQGGSENVEKEKRTPKANQFYHNSEFLLAKDKFPPAESNKKSKLSWKKQGGGEMGHGLRMGSKFFKSCSSLLEKLMKHKHAWVFNSPVDVEGLGLHDYFTIITHPMDLGTVKNRLNKNWYKSPKEFAEDVRLTFNNAMTYNPKGQDVHVMAENLSKIFEDRWAIIESDYNREIRYGMEYGAAPPAPSHLSRRVPAFTPPALDMRRILDRSESLARTPRPMNITPSSRTPAPKKPKAKDPHKRDMTFDEKQKLSTNLQSLPPEKLDAIVQIIKRRNLALNQHDDEIEVDIDSVDAETLWELDRFVTNYKKSLSKNKRRAELARARAEALQNSIQRSQPPAMVEIPRETQADERNVPPSLPMQGGNQADNRSRSSSSSSSSSDSGSSSSDSDSDSSSASSDAGSQGT